MTDDSATLRAEHIDNIAKAMQSRNALFMLVDQPWESISNDERFLWRNLADAALFVSQSSWVKERADLQEELAEVRKIANELSDALTKSANERVKLERQLAEADAVVDALWSGINGKVIDYIPAHRRAAIERHASRPVTVKE